MRFRAFAISLCVLVSTVAAQARVLDFPDLRKIVTFSEPQLSPDGRSLAYLRSHQNWQADRTETDLMLMDVRTRAVRQLTYDRRGVGSPRWSSDGTRIAFVANALTGKEQQSQVFIMPMNGGDALKLTSAPQGVDTFAWSPDGKRIAYVAQDVAPNKKDLDKHLDAFAVGSNDYLQTTAAVPSHLWMISARPAAKALRLTNGTFSLSTQEPNAGSPVSWSADGRYIAFTRFPNAIYGDSLGSLLYAYDTQTRTLRKLTQHSRLEAEPQYAPHGALLAYTRSTKGDPTNGNGVFVTAAGANGRDIRRNLDRNIDAKTWLPDSSGLVLAGVDGTHTTMWVQPLGAPARSVNLGDIDLAQIGNFSRGGAMAFVGTRQHHPSEIFYLSSVDARPVALTNANAAIERLQLGRMTTLTWRGTGGFHEDGVLTYPPGFVRGKKYPLVLYIHGGPQSASTLNFSLRTQLFASHGYLVFSPNYRGSTNLGDAYQHAIYHDAGQGPGEDVMAGVAAVRALGIVDDSRIAVSGWSYGGYMTSWLEGHYHIWKVAMAGAALNDWYDDYNVSFYVNTDVPWFGGSPWNAKYEAMWRAQSPLTYASQIKTPTLIMGDAFDPNVTITNSYKMYHALKDNNVPVEFIVIPVHGHVPSDPVRSEDLGRNWLSWLDRYLK